MTEADWLTSTDPQAMLTYLRGQYHDELVPGYEPVIRCLRLGSDRKLRLFVEACRVMAGHGGSLDLDDPDGLIEAVRAWSRVPLPSQHPNGKQRANLLRDIFGNPYRPIGSDVKKLICPQCHRKDDFLGLEATPDKNRYYCRHCDVTAISPLSRWLTWNDGIVVKLAQAAYDERLDDGTLDAGRLGVIADALEEAGCTEEVILRHLRGEAQEVCPACGGVGECSVEDLDGRTYHRGDCSRCSTTGLIWRRTDAPHVRGCWCLDLILGKE